MKMGSAILVSSLPILAAALPVYAQDVGWYAGVNTGQSNYQAYNTNTQLLSDQFTSQGFPNSTSSSQTDTGYGFFLGYAFNQFIALEGGYTDTGNATFNVTFLPPYTGNYYGSTNMTAWSLETVGSWPLTRRFSLFAKSGMVHDGVEADATLSSLGNTNSTSYAASSTDLTYGFGAALYLAGPLTGRLGWQKFHKVGNATTTGQGDIDYTYVALMYSF